MPDVIIGVLLAAGRGARFGGNKLLSPLPDGMPVAIAAARRLRAALPNSLAVVREEDETLMALLAAEGLRIVINPNAEQGMGTSLACGVAATEADGWVIALADMPAIRADTIHAVADAIAAGAPLAAPLYRGRRGHPTGFSRCYRTALAELNGDQGGRDILAQQAGTLHRIEVDDPGVLYDVDYADDLRAHEGLCAKTLTAGRWRT